MKSSRYPMRASGLEERRRFYRDEFDVRSLGTWIGRRQRTTKFAMIPGRISGIFNPRHAEDKDNVVLIDVWRSAYDIRRFALEYLPEGVYYDRNRYIDVRKCRECGDRKRSCPECYNFDGQQLAFDLDPENVDCPYHGHIGEKMDTGRTHSFCMYEFKSVRRQSIGLKTEMMKEYDRVDVVFSGRGFHVVVDDEEGYALTNKERRQLASRMGKRFDIDEWVTAGSSRLMRLPYSLNALVSRKCMRIKDERVLEEFDPRTSEDVLPRFMA